MKRRSFLSAISIGSGGILLASPSIAQSTITGSSGKMKNAEQLRADVIIAGGGMGACAAALAACRNGMKVILTEETEWIGGQVSQQGVPFDEHPWIETHGAPASYREYRKRIRNYYQRNYPLTADAKKRENLNPGDGSVSLLCHEPLVSVAVLTEMLMPFISTGKLTILTDCKIKSADVEGDLVKAVEAYHRKTEQSVILNAPYFIGRNRMRRLTPLNRNRIYHRHRVKKPDRRITCPGSSQSKEQSGFYALLCDGLSARCKQHHRSSRKTMISGVTMFLKWTSHGRADC